MIKLAQALENCLTRIQLEGASLEDCLKSYPELNGELKPLLIAAQNMAALKNLQPSAEFKSKLRGTLGVQMARPPRSRAALPIGVIRYAASVAVLVLALLTSGTALAQRALPGDVLYHWKLESETLWRSLQADKVTADILLGNRRIQELKAIEGMPELEEIAFSTYRGLLTRLAGQLTSEPDKIPGAQKALNAQKADLQLFYSDHPEHPEHPDRPNLDELFDVIPKGNGNGGPPDEHPGNGPTQ